MAIKVLIVDDEPAIAESLQAFLQARGYEASSAPDGPEGVAAARKSKPDLMLLDIMLPTLDGIEVCRILKADAGTKDIRIVMMTGLGHTSDLELALTAGADGYLAKPYDLDQLIQKIQKVLAGPGPA
ncbi:MAG: response regulator [Elusimicrobia bacterium]|nr:response regulator [Elusimicrobiota bacterium]